MAVAEALRGAYLAHMALIRSTVSGIALARFDRLTEYRDEQAAAYAATVAPLVTAGQRAAVVATAVYFRLLAAEAGAPAAEVDPDDFVGSATRGVAPELVYERPFHTIWRGLAAGMLLAAAVAQGRNQVGAHVVTDMTVASRNAAGAMMGGDSGIIGWVRILGGSSPCPTCVDASKGFYRRDGLMPIHPHCSCGVEPVYSKFSDRQPEAAVAQNDSELGPTFEEAP